ncbi:cAMP-specific 3',5'-cyclic phosphodiesterase 4D-like [Hylobates moloch]|uniref:cAMP-specific 3',5'-cyclic phosphodiesterase 4D-like n=1 Tax=Hylobates moloch TaxID=81572 RepID=UPI002676D75B|nr:cAMP-specific 3',5'-cyclic phosphodiesterase 4D-like [Hylobates moloch]
MKRNTCDLLSRSKSASEETLHSSNEEEDPFRGMEPYLVRRLSCRNIQLPPLAFRQLEQADLKSESENIQRPTSLPLKILPLIAITSAESSGLNYRNNKEGRWDDRKHRRIGSRMEAEGGIKNKDKERKGKEKENEK